MATVINVANAAQLSAALASARGGETIVLAGGNYGRLDLAGKSYASEVRLVSADPDDPAVFSGGTLNNVDNLTVESVTLDYKAPAGASIYTNVLDIRNCSGVTVRDSVFDGDLATGVSAAEDGYGTGVGVLASQSSDIVIEGCEFFDLYRAGSATNSTNVTIRDNDVHDIRSDGFVFTVLDGLAFTGNSLHDFRPAPGSGDHVDMLQFWTLNTTTPSKNILIDGNAFLTGSGGVAQVIFMRNEAVDLQGAGAAMFYQNVTITNNVIHGQSAHGITLGAANGVLVGNNTVLHASSGVFGATTPPIISVHGRSTAVQILNNIAEAITPVATGWSVLNNLIVQGTDPTGASYYGALFMDALLAGATLADLRFLPAVAATLAGMGAAMTQFDPTPDALTAQIVTDRSVFGTVLFDGSLTADSAGFVRGSDASFHWDFGDGSTGTGVGAAHRYATPGTYVATLTVTHADGSVDTDTTVVHVGAPLLLRIDAQGGTVKDLSTYGSALSGTSKVTTVTLPDGNEVIRVTGSSGFQVVRDTAEQIYSRNAFLLSFGMKSAAGGGSAGELVALLNSWGVTVRSDGELVFRFQGGGGTDSTVTIVTKGAGLLDDAWHRVAVNYNGETGLLDILVDGFNVGGGQVTGLTQAIRGLGTYGYNLGIGQYVGTGFNGWLDDLRLVSTPLKLTHGADAIDILGTASDDVISGTGLDEWLYGRDGSDTLSGGDGDDVISGHDGDDVLAGDDDNDRISGGTGDDSLDGGSGSDTLAGGSEDDRLDGFTGADRLYGGDGNDRLAGGTGNDTLSGGLGSDIFVARAADGTDTIVRFEAGIDRVEIAGAGLTFADLTFRTLSSNSVEVSFGATTLVFTGLTGPLDSDSFLFT